MIIPTLSIIIPFTGSVSPLKKCLSALEHQKQPNTDFEVIVVDNNPTAHLPLTSSLNLRWIHEPKLGAYTARNSGLQIARGKVIAFTDSDCEADPNWISGGIEQMKKWDVAAGEVVFTYGQTEKPTAREVYDSLTSITQRYFATVEGFGATANLWTKIEVLRCLGGFEDSLFSGGDVEWCHRARKNGFNFSFLPQVIVYHPARSAISAIVKRARRAFAGRRAIRQINDRVKFSVLLRVRFLLRSLFQFIRQGRIGLVLLVMAIGVVVRISVAIEAVRLLFGGRPARL